MLSGNIQNQHLVDFPFPAGNKGWIPSEDTDRTHHLGWLFSGSMPGAISTHRKALKWALSFSVSFELILGIGFPG